MKTILVTYFDNALEKTICRAYVVLESNFDRDFAWIKRDYKHMSNQGLSSKVKFTIIDKISISMITY